MFSFLPPVDLTFMVTAPKNPGPPSGLCVYLPGSQRVWHNDGLSYADMVALKKRSNDPKKKERTILTEKSFPGFT
jgi:hypothetical protein